MFPWHDLHRWTRVCVGPLLAAQQVDSWKLEAIRGWSFDCGGLCVCCCACFSLLVCFVSSLAGSSCWCLPQLVNAVFLQSCDFFACVCEKFRRHLFFFIVGADPRELDINNIKQLSCFGPAHSICIFPLRLLCVVCLSFNWLARMDLLILCLIAVAIMSILLFAFGSWKSLRPRTIAPGLLEPFA